MIKNVLLIQIQEDEEENSHESNSIFHSTGSESALTSSPSLDSNSILSLTDDFSLDSLFLDQESNESNVNARDMIQQKEPSFSGANPLQVNTAQFLVLRIFQIVRETN